MNLRHSEDISKIVVITRHNPIPDPNRQGYVKYKESFADFTDKAEIQTHHHSWLGRDGRTNDRDKTSSITLREFPLRKGRSLFTVYIKDKTNSWTECFFSSLDYIPKREFGKNHFEERVGKRIKWATEREEPLTEQEISALRAEYGNVLNKLFEN